MPVPPEEAGVEKRDVNAYSIQYGLRPDTDRTHEETE
jgi:hypothetical protein